jgi:signal transduction histidine kinase
MKRKFPPPLGLLVPLLLLVAGLISSWLEYELDLASALDRNLRDVTALAEVTGNHLSASAGHHLGRQDLGMLRQTPLEWNVVPWLRVAAVVDAAGEILACSDAAQEGRAVADSPAQAAWELAGSGADKKVKASTSSRGETIVLGAFPITPKAADKKWLLLVYDRAGAVDQAHRDARRQAARSISVLGLFCLCVWGILHFGVAARLERLARSARDFGEGRSSQIGIIEGGDEVHELSKALSEMGRNLTEREDQRRDLERQVIDSAESERRRIGHELHDGIGQQLGGLLMAANSLEGELRKNAMAFAGQAEHLSRQLQEAIREVRGISHGLAPVPLWDRGIEDALQALAHSTEKNTGVRCVFDCPDAVVVSHEATAGNLYRIAQEAVSNALKHASPGEIRIGLERRGEMIVLEIDDDGCGLPEPLPQGGGIGFRVMRLRAEIMRGNLECGTAPAGGTRIAAYVPIRP